MKKINFLLVAMTMLFCCQFINVNALTLSNQPSNEQENKQEEKKTGESNNQEEKKTPQNNEQEKKTQENVGDIIEVAKKDGRFKTLLEVLNVAKLTDTLKGEGPFTVFAPTDDAFARLSQDKLQELLKPQAKEKLQKILTYHVSKGKILASDIQKLNGKEIQMLNGVKVKIEVKNNQVYVNGAKVIITDIQCKNGVIHVIDKVLMP